MLPFAVPDFNIKKFLANAQISYRFTLDSKYETASIQDNFRRLCNENSNECHFETRLAIKLIIIAIEVVAK